MLGSARYWNQDVDVSLHLTGTLTADFGSWQVVGTYGLDINSLGKPLHTVAGYRALAVDYSEKGRYGRNGLDIVQHGPVMGVTLNW